MAMKIYRIQWRHDFFGWNTVFVLAENEHAALISAKAHPPKGTGKEMWDCVTSSPVYSIRKANRFYACPEV